MIDVNREKDLEAVRKALRKAAELKDPQEMWTLVKDALNLLTLICTGAA